MRLTIYELEGPEEEFINASMSFSSDASTNYRNFGGSRHGFNPQNLDRPSIIHGAKSSPFPNQGFWPQNRTATLRVHSIDSTRPSNMVSTSGAGYQRGFVVEEVEEKDLPMGSTSGAGYQRGFMVEEVEEKDFLMGNKTTASSGMLPSIAGQALKAMDQRDVCKCPGGRMGRLSTLSTDQTACRFANTQHSADFGSSGPSQPLSLKDMLNSSAPAKYHSPGTSGTSGTPQPPLNQRSRQPSQELAFFNLSPPSPLQSAPPQLQESQPWQNSDQEYQHQPTLRPSIASEWSDTSMNTLRPRTNIDEQRRSLLVDLYRQCLDASTNYIRVRRERGHRHQPYELHGRRCRSPKQCHHSTRIITQSLRGTIHGEPSLMDNISQICTRIWRRARSFGIAPRRAEAETVRVMRDLYVWGEILVCGFEGDGGIEDCDDGSVSGMISLAGVDDGEAVKTAEAGKRLCQWLRDNDAEVVCDEIAEALRDLEREERAVSGSDVAERLGIL